MSDGWMRSLGMLSYIPVVINLAITINCFLLVAAYVVVKFNTMKVDRAVDPHIGGKTILFFLRMTGLNTALFGGLSLLIYLCFGLIYPSIVAVKPIVTMGSLCLAGIVLFLVFNLFIGYFTNSSNMTRTENFFNAVQIFIWGAVLTWGVVGMAISLVNEIKMLMLFIPMIIGSGAVFAYFTNLYFAKVKIQEEKREAAV